TVNELIGEDYSPTPQYLHAEDRFCPHDDGNACHRAIQWFIAGDHSGIKQIETSRRPSDVYWGGSTDKTERTREFPNEVDNAARMDDRDVTLFVAHSVKSNQSAMDQIRQMAPSISVIARTDYEMIMTAEEKAARNGNNDSAQLRTPTR